LGIDLNFGKNISLTVGSNAVAPTAGIGKILTLETSVAFHF
jgi:hypothetical protein